MDGKELISKRERERELILKELNFWIIIKRIRVVISGKNKGNIKYQQSRLFPHDVTKHPLDSYVSFFPIKSMNESSSLYLLVTDNEDWD